MCRSRSAFLHRCGRGNSTWKRVHLVSRPLETSFYGTLALGETGKQSEFCSFSWSCETSIVSLPLFLQAEWSEPNSVTIKKHLPHPYKTNWTMKKTSNHHPPTKKEIGVGEKKPAAPSASAKKSTKTTETCWNPEFPAARHNLRSSLDQAQGRRKQCTHIPSMGRTVRFT